ncbi:L-lactate dehydrogenase complex protein LldG [Lacibacter cauensis]|uniref:L-lactate dehydrogenase complex protein LldG n=1 Tax=Lacibacter cauensis TaxID=510947 RepID=A0A562SQI2_9BACT|nr:lactate utilization protein [Lacibacter cauensis]TWI83519.1 L-lactate dehydrogenase complex protein LldG [Lacibacter cauensis]
MSVSASKENILKKIRQALSHPVPVPFPQSEGNNSVFQPPVDDMAVQFAQEFTKLQGKFVFCADEKDMAEQLLQLAAARKWDKVVCREQKLQQIFKQLKIPINFHDNLADSDVSFTTCELLVSRTGTMVLSTANESGRTTSVYAPVHICIAYTSQLVYDLKDAIQVLREKYQGQLPSFISFATGPSRTADIEKTLVVGVHGPKEVFVFLIEG